MLEAVGPDGPEFDGVPVARGAAMATGEYGEGERLYQRLPAIHRAYDEPDAKVQGQGQLRRFLQIFAARSTFSRMSAAIPSGTIRSIESSERVAVFVHSTAGSEALGAALGRSLVPGLRLSVMPLPGGDLRVLCVTEGALPSEPEQSAAPDGTTPAAPDPAGGTTPGGTP